MADESSAGFLGRSVMRLEDHKLLRGAGRFVDDIALPGVLHAAVAAGRVLSSPTSKEVTVITWVLQVV